MCICSCLFSSWNSVLILLEIAKITAIEQNNQNLLYALPQISYLEAVQKTFSAEYI